jgi:GntR family transcriptional regulator/MocR family aminotransferase
MNLILSMDRDTSTGVRGHLTQQLRAAILNRQVLPGEMLPSTRVLAEAIGVARGTVVTAYEDLAGEGYVDVVPGVGTFVTAFLSGGGANDRHKRALPVAAAGETAAAGNRPPKPRLLDLRPGQPSTRSLARDCIRRRGTTSPQRPRPYRWTLEEYLVAFSVRPRLFGGAGSPVVVV